MTRLTDAKNQIKKQFNINPDDYLPKNDLNAWNKYKEYNFLYNKMFIANLENLKYAPMPIEPDNYPVVSKPIINLYGMGLSSCIIKSKKEFYQNWLSTNFWCEYLDGNHYSWDIVIRKGKIMYNICFLGHKFSDSDRFGCFSYWELITEEINIPNNIQNLIKLYLKNFTGNLNIETIAGKIIEVHLRMGDIDQLPSNILKLIILNLVIDDDKYDNILKNAFLRNNLTEKIYLIPVWYKIKNNESIDELIIYVKDKWEPVVKKNKSIFFYYFDDLNQASPNNFKRLFLFSTYNFDIITKLKYDIEYDVLKNFG